MDINGLFKLVIQALMQNLGRGYGRLIKAPQKMLFFMWLFLHKAIPTNDFHKYRHLTNDASCTSCNGDLEDGL